MDTWVAIDTIVRSHSQLALRACIGCVAALVLLGCGDDDDGVSQADRLGVGAECSSSGDCLREGDGGINLACLDQFKGGYCGLEDCNGDDDCPEQSICVAHEDGNNYCFRTCSDKPECNLNRTKDNESNCASKLEYVDPDSDGKACVPPSASD